MPNYNKTQRLNLKTRANLNRATRNNGVTATRNPLNGAVMGYNNYWKGRRQYVDYLIKYGKISEEQGERYLKLISNNNQTLNNATKKALKPWLLPEAPPGFKPHPPSYPRKTLQLSKNLNRNRNRNNNPVTYNKNSNSGRRTPMTPDPVQQGGAYRVFYGKITDKTGKEYHNYNFSKGNNRGLNAYWQDINEKLEKHVESSFDSKDIMTSGFGGDDDSGVVVVKNTTDELAPMEFTVNNQKYVMSFERFEDSSNNEVKA